MRGWAIAALAFLFVMPSAGAGPVGPACIPTCDVSTSQFANTPPVVVLGTGALLTWSSGDGARHTATSDGGCFDVSILRDVPGSISFAARDGVLFAIAASGVETACPEAVALDGQALALAYRCTIHPTFQQGALVVRAG